MYIRAPTTGLIKQPCKPVKRRWCVDYVKAIDNVHISPTENTGDPVLKG